MSGKQATACELLQHERSDGWRQLLRHTPGQALGRNNSYKRRPEVNYTGG